MSAPLPLQGLAGAQIVIRGVNWLGDAVMTTPALLRLRQAWPKASISLLSPEKLADLWLQHPALDRVLSFGPKENAWSVAKRLREEQFDLGLVLPNSFRSAFELWRAGIPLRIGYGGQWRTWLLTHPVPPHPDAVRMRKRPPSEIRKLLEEKELKPPAPTIPNQAHHLHQYLHLVSQLGADATPIAPQLAIADSEIRAALQQAQIDPASKPLLFALNPGAEYGPAKRWPVESFVAAARAIHARTGCQWVIVGGNDDRALAEQVASELSQSERPVGTDIAHSVLNLAGRTTLRELCAILKACRVLLTNDTGPMHVAAAVGTPVVVPFGSTSPELTGPGLPGGSRHQLLRARSVPCSPCFLRRCPIDFRCMQQIQVADVVEAVCRAVKD